jgi:polysaccharide pyruvyl transferase WcaK-like protein
MTDSIFHNMVRLVQSSDCQAIAMPEHMVAAVDKSKKRIIPYIALTANELHQCDLVVVHKGLLHRLGYETLSTLVMRFDATYADTVFVCYEPRGRMGSGLSTPPGEERGAFIQHVPPVRNFLAGEDIELPHRERIESAVLVSAYGVGNVGDDLVSFAARKMLQDAGVPKVELAGPAVSRAAIAKADVVAVGGGGLFYDASLENVANYLYPLQEARRLGKFSAVLGVGVQGIWTPVGKSAYATHLEHADFLSVRDPRDRQELIDIDPKLSRAMAGADMAFYMADDVRRVAQPFRVDKPLALFSLSDMLNGALARHGHKAREVALEVIGWLRSNGYEVVLVLHSEDDRKLFQELSQTLQLTMIESAACGLGATVRLYASADLVVTSRYHGLILGLLTGRRVVALNGQTSKTVKLISSYLGSIREQCELLESFNLDGFLRKLKDAQPVEPREVEHCIAMTHAMRAELERRLRTYGR